MLKKPAWRVIAALGASTYRKAYASVPRLLRPRWTAFLTILQTILTAAARSNSMCDLQGIQQWFFRSLLGS
jgi:hypothetical protein